MSRIIVIGSSNTDMVVKSEKLPSPGETILGGRILINNELKSTFTLNEHRI